MKNKVLAIFFTGSLAFANIGNYKNNIKTQIENVLSKTTNTQIKVLDVEKDENFDNYGYVLVQAKKNNSVQETVMNYLIDKHNNVYIMPVNKMLSLKTNQIYINPKLLTMLGKIQLDRAKQQQKINKKIKQKISTNDIIWITKPQKNNKTIIFFLDPECPFCKQKINQLKYIKETALKNHINIGIILHPLVNIKNGKVEKRTSLHPNALNISAVLLEKLRNTKPGDEKIISILQSTIKNSNKINDNTPKNEYKKQMINLYNKYNEVNYTPFVISLSPKETNNILKK